jgi:glycerophosphoryl diester phosphodiesterase
MRSSRSGPDPLDPGRNGFTHRGLHKAPSLPENTLVAFAASLELGAGIECDLRLTADDQVVVFHDRDASRLCGDPAIVGQSSLAQLKRLRVSGHSIPTLGDLLHLVGGRVPILLEAKVADDLWRFGPALVRALDGYDGPVGVMSFDPRLLRWVKTNAPSIRRGWVVRDSLSRLKRWAGMRLADPQFLAVDRGAARRPWVSRARERLPVYCWTVHGADERRSVQSNVDALIWEADGRP